MPLGGEADDLDLAPRRLDRAACGAVYQLGGGVGWLHAGGWIALAIFVVAMYGGLAFLLEDAVPSLPLLRRGKSREAVEGGLERQLQSLAEEAGVRHTL